MLPVVQLADVLPHIGAPNAGMALHAQVVTESQYHLVEGGGLKKLMRGKEEGEEAKKKG